MIVKYKLWNGYLKLLNRGFFLFPTIRVSNQTWEWAKCQERCLAEKEQRLCNWFISSSKMGLEALKAGACGGKSDITSCTSFEFTLYTLILELSTFHLVIWLIVTDPVAEPFSRESFPLGAEGQSWKRIDCISNYFQLSGHSLSKGNLERPQYFLIFLHRSSMNFILDIRPHFQHLVALAIQAIILSNFVSPWLCCR